jgi:crossover junction endodeoxyribonuclease RusA
VTVAFEVIGLPAPQGSKRHVGNGVMVESSKKLKPWRDAVTAAAREAQEQFGTIDGPVEVVMVFRFPPVKSEPYRRRHATKPDADKLARGVLDALTHARLIGDDSHVWALHASKRYALDGQAIGASVEVWSHGEAEAWDRRHLKEAAKAAAKRRAA